MNWFDGVLLVVLLSAGSAGFRLGFVTRAASWTMMAVGLLAGTWLVPKVLRAIRDSSTQGQLFLAAAVLLVLSALLGQAVGLLLGSRLAHRVRSPAARRRDQYGGAAAGVLGIVALVWVLAPAMASVPGGTARVARGSFVVRTLHTVLPGAPDATRSLRQLVGAPSPDVFGAVHRTPSAGPVPATGGLSDEVVALAKGSTVRIEGQACALTQEGSGFVVSENTVVTNAHVIAGEKSTIVITPDGRRLPATARSFDALRDVAVLDVPDLDLEPLLLAPAEIGGRGAVFGYPGGGALRLSPYQVADKVLATGRDIYDRHSTTRLVLILAVDLAPGDSGAPVIDQEGAVIGMAFAVAPDRNGVGYALPAADLWGGNTKKPHARADTGRCIG